jgi:phage tail-like protein
VRKSLGQTDWDPVTLKRGVTHDVEFEKWANKVWDYPNSAQLGKMSSLGDFRKDIILEVLNETGQKVIAYKLHRCWPSEFIAMPELNSMNNAIAIQSLVLQLEGWERDESVKEPTEPKFDDPAGG